VSSAPFSIGTKILGGGALVLILFLVVGFLLPGTWDAEATRLVAARPEAVFRYLDSPEGWRAWTPWPDSGVVRSGPATGKGATLSWSDPNLGSGSFSLVDVTPPERVAYEVDVGSGSMRTHGTVTLTPEDDGVRVTWHEAGDLGHNPLMGYWALSMGRAQGQELSKSLDRLAALVVDSAQVRAPADSSATPAGR
jgi:uncharacterized protein YndB with AHSA1/START domain